MEAATPREMLVLLLVDLGQTTDRPGSPGHHPNSRNGGREALVEIAEGGQCRVSLTPKGVLVANPRRRSWCRLGAEGSEVPSSSPAPAAHTAGAGPSAPGPQPAFRLGPSTVRSLSHASQHGRLPTHRRVKPARSGERYLLQVHDLVVHVFLLSVDRRPRDVTCRKTHSPLKDLRRRKNAWLHLKKNLEGSNTTLKKQQNYFSVCGVFVV